MSEQRLVQPAQTAPTGPARLRPQHPQHLPLPLFLLAATVYLELVVRVRAQGPFLNDGLLRLTLAAAALSLLMLLVAGFFPRGGRAVVVGLYLALLTFLFGSQLVYYDIFQTFYTAFSAMHGAQVMEFAGDILTKVGQNYLWILLLLVPLTLFVLLRERVIGPAARPTWTERGLTAAVLVAVLGLTVATMNLGSRERGAPYDLYYRAGDPATSVNRLGLLTTMRVDLQRTLLGAQPEPAPPPPVVVAPEKPRPNPTASPGAAEKPELGTAAPVYDEPNAVDIDFQTLLAEAAGSEQLANMHQYFAAREPTRKNAHTGMFEGYNLVFLTAEAYSHYAVDPDLTPTLHKMTHEGFDFTNFYNPIWGVSTSDGEYVATTGLLPKSGVWSMYQSGDNAMPFTMGNQLQRLGYTTRAYHNHTYDYYRRDVSHPNLGYEYKGLGNGLEVARTWPASDLEMVDVTTSEYVSEEPFHAYYMTVSGHQFYNFGGNFIAQKNRDLVEGLPYTTAGRAYLATQIELDRALELLLERLDEAGVADRTLIVLSADHYPYGLTQEEISDLAGHEVTGNELHRSSLIIYAPGMEPEVVDRPVSSLDIIPTVSNLLGLEFDSRLLMGTDAFSDGDPLVIFNDRSFITDRGRYDSGTREFVAHYGVEVPGDYQQRISDEIERRFYYSMLILDEDYYRLVVDR